MPERFSAQLTETDSGGGLRWIEVPFDPKERFGQARAPVRGTLNGTEFRGRVSIYDGRAVLGLNKEVRQAAGLELGDRVDVVLELDDAPREVEVPKALAEALALADDAREAFSRLSFTHRREYARWIAEAKKDETRERRVTKAVELLREGVKTPD
ncbi:MAG: YdeI/OmpD-associated family protein [Thermoleophilaceae bacterium]